MTPVRKANEAMNVVRSVTLYRIDPEKNMRRFYYLDVQPDLFGNQS